MLKAAWQMEKLCVTWEAEAYSAVPLTTNGELCSFLLAYQTCLQPGKIYSNKCIVLSTTAILQNKWGSNHHAFWGGAQTTRSLCNLNLFLVFPIKSQFLFLSYTQINTDRRLTLVCFLFLQQLVCIIAWQTLNQRFQLKWCQPFTSCVVTSCYEDM